jgi:two-component sensor histidine kinase/CheY-like chemotaxis protein
MKTSTAHTILIVDDEPHNLDVLNSFLQKSGFKVLVATDGEQALKRVSHVRPDLILLDVNLPGIDGFETCRRLQATDAIRDVPIVFITVDADTVNKVKGFEMNAADYITKPFDPEEVLARIGKHLQVQRLQDELKAKNAQLEREIAERLRAEEALTFERAQLLSIFDSIDKFIYVIDPESFEILYVNQALTEAFQEELVGRVCYRALQGLDAPCDFCTNEIILKQKPAPYRWEYHNPILGKDFDIVDRIISWPDGRDVRFELAIDVTSRNRAKEQIEAALKEKEILLSEIHHRVKNNMQVILSLLRLQAGKIEDKQHADMFVETESRIRSMALVHETLYQSKDFENIDFDAYVKTISTHLLRSYAVIPDKIKLERDIGNISLKLDHAIPCGLLINELISNALKYAFPEDGIGKIKIIFRSINDHEVELTVSDDGIGIPKEIDIKTVDSMGLQLVNVLAEGQLEGEVELDRDGGTAFRIRFKN